MFCNKVFIQKASRDEQIDLNNWLNIMKRIKQVGLLLWHILFLRFHYIVQYWIFLYFAHLPHLILLWPTSFFTLRDYLYTISFILLYCFLPNGLLYIYILFHLASLSVNLFVLGKLFWLDNLSMYHNILSIIFIIIIITITRDWPLIVLLSKSEHCTEYILSIVWNQIISFYTD